MKLSEILGWRKKDKIHLLFNGRYSQVALETALTSCDREIDMEALANVLFNRQPYLRYSREEMKEWADSIISTMPKWLKMIEDK